MNGTASTQSIRRLLIGTALGALMGASFGGDAVAQALAGSVVDADGERIAGAMVTFRRGEPGEDPIHDTTVYSARDGSYRSPALTPGAVYEVRARRVGWHDLYLDKQRAPEAEDQIWHLDLIMEQAKSPAEVAEQLPSNIWYSLVLAKLDNEEEREELVRQCTFCHQQGSAATRIQRSEEEWMKVLALMGRMGAGLNEPLRSRVPELFNAAYDPETAIPRLQEMNAVAMVPTPTGEAGDAVIEEWELGHWASMQHDIVVHPSGHIYSVDMTQDALYRLDPREGEGKREMFEIPREGTPLGGVFGSALLPPNANMHVGPHSLQVGPDGAVWITLAIGNKIARFDPADESWKMYEVEDAYYPHTLRIDQRGRVWYTNAASNHIGMLDPETGEHRWIRLPARDWRQDLRIRLMPVMLWAARTFDLAPSGEGGGEGLDAPVPYGIDVSPDGSVWFSQLNEHRIGRIDPETLEVEVIDTPFPAPRRLRFDSKGVLWIPSFSSGKLASFDPESGNFETYTIPIEPIGSETPYSVNVDRSRDIVWICGTNSDTLISFDPKADEGDRFTVYPLPTRVTYTREIDFDATGGVWTSNSNAPNWQIEEGFPRIIRLDPDAMG